MATYLVPEGKVRIPYLLSSASAYNIEFPDCNISTLSDRAKQIRKRAADDMGDYGTRTETWPTHTGYYHHMAGGERGVMLIHNERQRVILEEGAVSR